MSKKVPKRFRETLVQSQVRFPEKVWEALVQSQVRFNRVPEKVWKPGQVQQGSQKGSGEGLGGFGAK